LDAEGPGITKMFWYHLRPVEVHCADGDVPLGEPGDDRERVGFAPG